jgi:hypothetical protein
MRTGSDFGPPMRFVTGPLRLVGQLDRFDARQQLLEQDRHLDPRQVDAQTRVGAEPEADVAIGLAVTIRCRRSVTAAAHSRRSPAISALI